MTSAKKQIIFILIAVLASLLILFAVYSVIDKKTEIITTADKAAEQFKEIETPGKKWLNGYFGIFFRFKYLGNINWLLLPLLIFFFLAGRKLQRWQMALVFVWLLTALFIVVKGYTNFRYQFTLFPFTATVILLLLWEIVKDKKTYVKITCFSILGLICVYNIYHYFDRYEFFWGIKVNDEKSRFPYQLINYLNNDGALRDSAKKVFVMEQPLFFYYTNQKGIDMQSPQAQWATTHLAGNSCSREGLFKEFKKVLHVEYILLNTSQLKLHQSLLLPEFLDCETRQVIKDSGWMLFRLREKPLERELRSPRFERYKLWPLRLKEKENGKVKSPLITFTEKGKFAFDYAREKLRGQETNCLVLRSIQPNEKNERMIHFGFELGRAGLKLVEIPVVRGRYLHFIVKAAASPTLLNRDNYMFISEFNGNAWSTTKIYFASPNLRTYVVSRLIGKDSQRVLWGFHFTPQTQGDSLRIQDARLYGSNDPL
jgi:hypothetical protein